MIRFKYIDKVPPFLKNRYVLTILIFTIWITLLDSNNLISRFRDVKELRKLQSDREYYTERIKTDRQKLHELKTDKHNLEKFAREQYHMKKANEDIFIILTPREDRQITRKNNR